MTERIQIAIPTSPTTVHRYRLPITDRPTVQLPRFAHVLSVGRSRDGRDELDLWATVDPDQDLVDVVFAIVGTGNPLPPDLGQHVGTVEHAAGALIFHVFHLPTAEPRA